MKFFKIKKYSILSNILKYSFVIVFGFMLVMPILFVNAATCSDGTIQAVCPDGSIGGGTNIKTKIDNPLGQTGPQTIPDFIKIIVNVVLVVGIPIIALAIIYTGFLFVKAQGSPDELTKAKNALLYVLIGGALLLGAFVIANAIQSTVDNITKGA